MDIEAVLDELEVFYENKGAEAVALCPMHKERTGKEDNSPSWWINLTTGQHICFSCHYSGSLLKLVCDIKGFHRSSWTKEVVYDYASAKAWIASISDITPDKLASALRSTPQHISSLPKPVEMSEARLAVFVNPPLDKLNERKISPESAVAYEVLWDNKTASWILPLRDPETSALLGWQEKGTDSRHFMNRPPGLKKASTLFGYGQMREDIVYVVESPLDCAHMMSEGFPGAVAVCGSTISEEQIKLIRSADRVIAAFDNAKLDTAGKKASDDMSKLCLKYGINLTFFNYGDSGKKDPGDLNRDELEWGIENSRSFLYGETAYV